MVFNWYVNYKEYIKKVRVLSNKEVEEMIINYMPLAGSIARKWAKKMDRYTYDEYLSLAYEGLVRGCKNYKKEKEFLPDTYLRPCINGAIMKFIYNDKWYNLRRSTPLEKMHYYLQQPSKEGSDTELGETLVNKIDMFEDVEIKIIIEQILASHKKKDRDREIIYLWLFGKCNFNDIAIILGNLTATTVGVVVRKFKNDVKELLMN